MNVYTVLVIMLSILTLCSEVHLSFQGIDEDLTRSKKQNKELTAKLVTQFQVKTRKDFLSNKIITIAMKIHLSFFFINKNPPELPD